MTAPLSIDSAQIGDLAARVWWPLLRVGGFMTTAPVIGSASVPVMTRIAMSIGIALLIAPSAQSPAGLTIFSAAGFLTTALQLMIGIAIGMVVQLVFDALAVGGQTISTAMGLGYANVIDPQHGTNTAVLGQLFTILGTLTYLSIDGHLALLGAFAHSFESMPVGREGLDRDFFAAVANWGSQVFESGLLIALPATVALIVVNLALGVVTRAAPQLNLLSIGFTITVLGGYFVLILGLDGLLAALGDLIGGALRMVADMTGHVQTALH